MTTSVDILFKELPAMSRADERISRPDASTIGSDESRDRSYVSKREKEKSFEEYIEGRDVVEERPIRTEPNVKEKSSTAEYIGFNEQVNDIEEQSIAKESSKVNLDVVDKNKSQESENKSSTVKVVEEDNEVYVNNNDIKIKDKAPSFTTKDLMLTETTAEKSALQNNVYSAQGNLKPNATNVPDQIIINSASSKNNPDQSKNQQFDQSTSSNNSSQSSGSNGNDITIKNTPLFTVSSNNQIDENSNIGIEPNSNIGANNLATEKRITLNEADTTLNSEQIIKNEFNLEPELVKETSSQISSDKINPLVTNIAEADVKGSNNINEQKSSLATEPTVLLPLNNEKIVDEIVPVINAVSNTMDQVIENSELMQKPLPQPDTVAVETSKTLPFAVTQNPNNVSKPTSSSRKPGSTAASVSGAASQSTSNKAQGAGQNNIAAAMLQSAQKSDIQIDLGLNGQKFDAPLGQSLTSSGQTSLPSNSVLAVQDVSFQKTLSGLSSTKVDVPMNAKMINEQITVAINKNVVKGLNNFSIRLHPAELGQVDIKLEFAADGKMHAAMMVESEKTLTMLQRDQSALEKALQDAGINLSNKDMNFSLMKQNQENNANKFAGLNGSTNIDSEIEELTEIGTMQEIRMSYSNQALDISV